MASQVYVVVKKSYVKLKKGKQSDEITSHYRHLLKEKEDLKMQLSKVGSVSVYTHITIDLIHDGRALSIIMMHEPWASLTSRHACHNVAVFLLNDASDQPDEVKLLG